MDSAGAGKTITFSEIEGTVGEKIAAWKPVLDRSTRTVSLRETRT
jgi:hypothetical protein